MNNDFEDRFPVRYLIYFLIIAIIISVAGYLLFLQRKNVIEEDLSRYILAIKNIKLQQIEKEQQQRINIIRSLIEHSDINSDFAFFLNRSSEKGPEKRIELFTRDLILNHRFTSLNIFNNTADLFFSTDSSYNIRQNFLKHELTLLLEKDSISVTNMYVSDNKKLMQAIIAPLFYRERTVGYIWAEYSYFEFIQPILYFSKEERGEIEYILFKKSGDIAYLLRDFSAKEDSSIYGIPLNQSDRENLRSVINKTDLISGLSIRGVQSYASVKEIPGTDWVLITKIDESEIISSFRNTAYIIFSIAFLLISLSASITYANWKRSRLHFISRTFRLRQEKEAISERYSSLTKYANDIILSVNREGDILEANQRAYDVYGYSFSELSAMNFLDLSVDKSKDTEIIFSSLRNEKGIVFETNHKRKNGSTIPVEISAKLIRQGDEEILLAIIRDNTERKKMQSELIVAKERAEENDRLKTIILANMSHELNTPMSGIIGFSEILMSDLSDADQKEMASIIHKSGTRLNDTLTSILDLSKIESQKLNLSFQVINIVPIIKDSLYAFRKQISEKGLVLKLDILNNEIPVKADALIINKIIRNIMSNAVKYTSSGTINVTARLKEENAEILIEDTGIGIPPSELEKIFEPFRQVSEGSTRNFEGTGIGLTITKKFVEILGGSIYIESVPDNGTKVSILFPLVA